MNKHNILTITLIISGLALNPVLANTVQNTLVQSQNTDHTITESISSILYNKGIEEESADEMALTFLSEEDEMLLAIMMQNLEMHNIVTKEEVLTYLSMAALHKQKIDFHSYDNIIGMVSTIKQKPVDESTRIQLSQIVKINQMLFV